MENKSLNKNEPIYPIGVASKLLGISVHTLRMYEKEGLIITARGTNQKIDCIPLLTSSEWSVSETQLQKRNTLFLR